MRETIWKIACPFCGGHVEFEQAHYGEVAPCPHCGEDIVLEQTIEVRIPRHEWKRKVAGHSKSIGLAAIAIAVACLAGVAILSGSSQLGQVLTGAFGIIAALTLMVLALGFYFLPAIVAWQRSHRNTAAILVLNLLLGWTLLGWALALVWAVYQEKK